MYLVELLSASNVLLRPMEGHGVYGGLGWGPGTARLRGFVETCGGP